MKDLVRKKKPAVWNEVVEKVNSDFERSKKKFWAFVGRKSKGKEWNIVSGKCFCN